MNPVERGEVVAFVAKSAALRERARPIIFRPRADRGDAVVDYLRTGVAVALDSLTVQAQECATCGGDGTVEEYTGRVLGDGGGECAVYSCDDCRGGEVEVLACCHGEAHEQGTPLHDPCVETWHYFLSPVGDADGAREIAVDPFGVMA